MQDDKKLLETASKVLKANDRGTYTVPAGDLYPHQWLWDSCFIAIGLRHIDVERAKLELISLLRGQWSSGMIPNMIFSPRRAYARDRNIWRSWLNPAAPSEVATSGITQPPMLAEAVVRVGNKMEWPERRLWYEEMWPALLNYHQWIYRERDPHGEGLALLIHPWECGMDNTPPWMNELRTHLLPMWIRLLHRTGLDNVMSLFRRDTRSTPINERYSNLEALALFSIQLRLRRKAYNIDRILDHSMFAIEDLAFNCILVRANEHLREIAKSIKKELPEDLEKRMRRTDKALEDLWDEQDQQYYSRDFVTHKLLREVSAASLLPLYAGIISKSRAEILVRRLENEHQFGLAYPVPSVPLSSPWFDKQRYWQGPTWLNMNWLIIDGLKRYGFTEHAGLLRDLSLEMVGKNGCAEYFNPLDGAPLGAENFSWTAALAIDLAKS